MPKLEGEKLDLMLTVDCPRQFALVGDLRERIVAVAGYSRASLQTWLVVAAVMGPLLALCVLVARIWPEGPIAAGMPEQYASLPRNASI